MINLELFSCAGGMAEGFRRAGIVFDIAVDFAPDHCESYERNLGHRPISMDVRDLVRLVRDRHVTWEVDLLVADPPCTPWSRAGKREGIADDRDMLVETCELIALLKPRRYLIGNVPGLDDGPNLGTVQRVIGGLSTHGYCTADFARLDAADYGVPQHRIRPFWFGHRGGPCVRWPSPSHCDPRQLINPQLPGITALEPWVTCREALGHLSGDDLGRPVKLKRRDSKHPAVRLDGPSTTVRGGGRGHSAPPIAITTSRHDVPVHTSDIDRPARTMTQAARAAGHASTITLNPRHTPADLDAPAPTMGAKMRGQGAQILSVEPHHPPSHIDEPAMVVRAGAGGGANRTMQVSGPKMRRRDVGRISQGERVGDPTKPAATITAKPAAAGGGASATLEWPWERPSTTLQRDDRIPPPGHHDEYSTRSMPDAVHLSERAAAILQGFPETWVFHGETKRARWSQIGQAMPPALAQAVARAIVEQDDA